ncbi:MAG TPA: Shedu anti-phage system protein SduA domain-containing protein [Terracidiphilus sp.]
MIKFVVDQDVMILEFSSDSWNSRWVWEELKTNGRVTISHVFTLERGDLINEPSKGQDIDEFEYQFHFAKRDGAYHRIKGRVFSIANDVLLADSGIKLEGKLFVAERNVSIFKRLAKVIGEDQDIAVGGSKSGSIPVDVFEHLLKKFPNSTELDHYANARVSNIIGEYFDGMRDFGKQYETYRSRRKTVVSTTPFLPQELLQAEIDKFTFIHNTIKEWLESSEGRTEKEWRKMLLNFILLIFPKYVTVLEEVQIEDHYSKPDVTTSRSIDIALVDVNGNLDIIEIKRPFDDVLLSKTQYRDNYVPTRDLSGTVMQAEKYLFRNHSARQKSERVHTCPTPTVGFLITV